MRFPRACGRKLRNRQPARDRRVVVDRSLWDPGRFADEQLHRLVRQVFFPGWPKPAQHVAFSAIDADTDIAPICMKVGEILAAQAPGQTCLVEANAYASDLDVRQFKGPEPVPDREARRLRDCSRHVRDKLWLLPRQVFLPEETNGDSGDWLARRMAQLRADFDYTVLHLPPAATHNEAAMLARLSDGIVLVLEANSTRRAAAQRAKEMLQAAQVRVIGSVLSGRTFPIPERIYRKL